MRESVSAAVHLQGSSLRYAEAERAESSHRLLRLGHRDFSFDVARELLDDNPGGSFDRVVEAIGDVLEGTEASTLAVSIHPPDGFSFFTPISAELPVRERKRHLLIQAALVTGSRSAKEMRMASQTVRTAQDSTGEAMMWVHVLAVTDTVDDRIADVTDELGARTHKWMLSTEAATRVTAATELTGITQEQALRPYTLAVGQYPSHTEYTLSRDRQWYHSHHAPEAKTPTDRVYFAVGLLNRLDVPLNAVGRLFLYGKDVDVDAHAPMRAVFGLETETLDPRNAVTGVDQFAPDDEDLCDYVPCIGAAGL